MSDKLPSTPEKRRGSIGSLLDAGPSTPPLRSSSSFGQGFGSPGDVVDNNFKAPSTPSNNSNRNGSRISNVPQTPMSGSGNRFQVQASPLKSPSSFHTHNDDDVPIRQISTNLKTRLSYAFVKYQNGWTNQSLDELEKVVDVTPNTDESSEFLKESSHLSPKKLHNSNSSTSNSLNSSNKVSKPQTLIHSPVITSKRFERRSSIDLNDENNEEGSANLAFLQAISKSRSPRKRFTNLTPSSSNNNLNGGLKIDLKPNTINETNPEAEAIETLMSLSSPQGFKPKDSLPKKELPKKKLNFNDNETDVDTESESGTDMDGEND